jgi:hypothetical protein
MYAIAAQPTTKKMPKNIASPRLPTVCEPVRRLPRFFSYNLKKRDNEIPLKVAQT